MLIKNYLISETNQYIIREFNNNPIKQRQSDGYFDTTTMCQATGKLFADYSCLSL
ncbi:hypothetical protein [Candidatus Parabeggiatoa sp. HSG14]|uniref:hypothetical protein n=1 Tax=Candidatus Parabeggiatoa sp. HSG14 TaxID=3055593 RepID=UPI0025A6DACE|nr:hypothetical protein [Thiotrichales bacterium HSG14]